MVVCPATPPGLQYSTISKDGDGKKGKKGKKKR